MNRFYQPLFVLELGARTQARKDELSKILDAETIADIQVLLGTTTSGIPTDDAWEWLARKGPTVRAFAGKRLAWPIDFQRSGLVHLDHPEGLLTQLGTAGTLFGRSPRRQALSVKSKADGD